MKKIKRLSALTAFALAAVMLTACAADNTPTLSVDPTMAPVAVATDAVDAAQTAEPTAEPTEAPIVLPIGDEALKFEFTSGVGAWTNELYLNGDGTFEGLFTDSDMGDVGDLYPNGTVYSCKYSGKFTDIEKIDDYSYVMKLDELTVDASQEAEVIGEEGVRYVLSDPYGLTGGTDFMLYLPDTPTSGLNEEFLSWWTGKYAAEIPAELGCFGLMNCTDGYGFFS